MEELSLDNILTGSEIENLFTEEPLEIEKEEKNAENLENVENSSKKETTEVNVNSLFAEEPESVGSEDKEEKEDTKFDKSSTSPTFYSSIAKAFAEEGIFPDLTEESISKIKSPEDLRDLVEQQIKAGLDEKLKRIDEALEVGIEPDVVRQYEGVIDYLSKIKEDTLIAETEEGEKLRKQLIYLDFINRGYTKERATREVQKSFNGGTDIEDAKDALKGNSDFFKTKYQEIIEEAKKDEEEEVTKRKERTEQLKASILNDKKIFGDIELDKNTRQKVFDNLAKPIYKDPNTGISYTALQKYEMEHKDDFLKNLSLIFTLTDGFKNLDGLVKGKVRKEVKKGLRELENTLNNTSRSFDGNLNYASGVGDESFIGKGWTVDI